MRTDIKRKLVYLAALLPWMTACQSDWRNGIAEEVPPTPDDQSEIAFTASVVASQAVTRADASLVNRKETTLFSTDETVGRPYGVGVFAYHTGPYAWSEAAALTDDAELATWYAPNLMYNQRMDITMSADHKTSSLAYVGDSLKRYWPNAVAGDRDGTDPRPRVTFWGYYPYTDTNPGNGRTLSYGVNVFANGRGVTTPTASGTLGTVSYRMNPDASQQSDFMLSELVADRSRDTNPLMSDGAGGRVPTPVSLRFHHMLAQVRLYAFVRGSDRMYYLRKGGQTVTVASVATDKLTLSDGTEVTTGSQTDKEGNKGWFYVNPYGLTKPVAVGDSLPDDTPWLPDGLRPTKARSERWLRNNVLDVSGVRYRAEADYSMAFNNIRTQADFTPAYKDGHTTFNATPRGSLGSVTVSHYIMNPYWFRFDGQGNRVMLNDNYMYDYFEQTPGYKASGMTAGEADTAKQQDGIDWKTYVNSSGETGKSNAMGYLLSDENADPDDLRGHKGDHFNYAPGNIILAVPQQLNDNDVPSVTINATGKLVKDYVWDGTRHEYKADEGTAVKVTARVTINLLQMNIRWESGYIYSYAFLEDDLQPNDDKVRGPESMLVVFDPSHSTWQW